MPKVTLIQQIFRSRKWMDLVYPAIASQTYKDVQVVAQIVEDDGNETNDGSCEDYIRKNFPQIIIEKPGYNIGFAKGHNEIFAKYDSEYYQLVNPDMIMEPEYVERLAQAMDQNPKLGAVTGKLLQCKNVGGQFEKLHTIDTTGVSMWRNGRAADRGQNQEDKGQYDAFTEIIAVSGAGPMYRRSALEDVKMRVSEGFEYFDEDFGSYWEDVDLSLRLQSRGWKCAFVPKALGYHGRTAASAKKDYADVSAYKKHHDSLPGRVKQLNYKNHIFMTVKNFRVPSWKFFAREFFMFGYLVLLERQTLKVVPEFIRQWPIIWKKRKIILKGQTTNDWHSLIKPRGIISVIDEDIGVDQSRYSLGHWTAEFVRLLKLVLGKK